MRHSKFLQIDSTVWRGWVDQPVKMWIVNVDINDQKTRLVVERAGTSPGISYFGFYCLGTCADNVLLEHDELPCVLPLAIHLDTFLTLRGTSGFNRNHVPPRPSKSYGVGGTPQVLGRLWDLDFGLGLANKITRLVVNKDKPRILIWNYGVSIWLWLRHSGLPTGLSLRLIKNILHNVLLKHGGLPCVLPSAVHLDMRF